MSISKRSRTPSGSACRTSNCPGRPVSNGATAKSSRKKRSRKKGPVKKASSRSNQNTTASSAYRSSPVDGEDISSDSSANEENRTKPTDDDQAMDQQPDKLSAVSDESAKAENDSAVAAEDFSKDILEQLNQHLSQAEDEFTEEDERELIASIAENNSMLNYRLLKQNAISYETLDLDMICHRPVLPLPTRSTARGRAGTLALDLDETLVHCSLQELASSDFAFDVRCAEALYRVYVRLRPGLMRFLERASELFEVVLFTASKKIYADRLLDQLDPKRSLIRHRLFREHCTPLTSPAGNEVIVGGPQYIKDLRVLGRDLSRTVLVDNCPQAFAAQPDNGIAIASWFSDPRDRELFKLLPFLELLAKQDDMRPLVRARRLQQLESGFIA